MLTGLQGDAVDDLTPDAQLATVKPTGPTTTAKPVGESYADTAQHNSKAAERQGNLVSFSIHDWGPAEANGVLIAGCCISRSQQLYMNCCLEYKNTPYIYHQLAA